jgi:hypothetical protein
MPYKIEVTADSLSELAGKVLALAAQFQVTSMPEQPVTPKAKPVKAAKAPVVEEVKTEEPKARDPAPEEAKGEKVRVEAAKAPTYDFNTDISPLVLRVAAEKGRPAIAELLSQFGVERASNVPAEQFGELLNALKDALGE